MSQVERGIEVIAGGMFCGKSEELIRRKHRLDIAQVPHQTFNHSINTRDGAAIASRNGGSVPAELVNSANIIPRVLLPDTKVVLIDEVNFFDDEIYHVVRWLSESRKMRVILGGLKDDFRGEPFGMMGEIMTAARDIQILHAVCTQCSSEADRTQRLINGEPDNYYNNTIVVEDKTGVSEVTYEARCNGCWVVAESPYQGVLYQSPK